MRLEQIEKELDKFKKLASTLDREIATNEGKLDSILDQLKKDFGVVKIEDADKTLEEMKIQVDMLEKEIAEKMNELNKNYGHLC
jgi:predicted  nucleic acid-binding Zn-ribbon protein